MSRPQDTTDQADNPVAVTPYQLLADLRAGGARAEAARARLAYHRASGGADAHAELRADVVSALLASLLPDDRPIACWLLEQEVACLRAGGRGASDALYALVAAVARFGEPDDALLIWRAREATPETRAGVDIEQLARAGVERVRAQLEAHIAAGGEPAAEASRVLAWLNEGVAAGALDHLAEYFAWSDEEYGLATDAPV